MITNNISRCVGVFDTVGSVGIPETLRLRSPKTVNILGMKDNVLGAHVERAYQALALNEMRKDFVSAHNILALRHCVDEILADVQQVGADRAGTS